MRPPARYAEIPQPARWGVAGATGLGAVGAVGGFIEAVAVYPLGSWFGVTLYLALIGALAGFVLGCVSAAASRRR